MKKLILFILLFITNTIFSQENLKFQEGIYSIELKIGENKNFLELDKENKIHILTTNIEPVNMSVVGTNLKIIKASNSDSLSNWLIVPNKENLTDGFYKLSVTFRGRKGKLYTHQFLIPVK